MINTPTLSAKAGQLHDAGWDIEIEVDSSGSVEVWGRHRDSGRTFDGPLFNTVDDLRVAIKDITLHHTADID